MPAAVRDPLDTLLTTDEAARAVGVTKHTVRKWRTRGWTSPDGTHRQLTNHGTKAEPKHRYRDVLDAEMETRSSGKSRRRPCLTEAA